MPTNQSKNSLKINFAYQGWARQQNGAEGRGAHTTLHKDFHPGQYSGRTAQGIPFFIIFVLSASDENIGAGLKASTWIKVTLNGLHTLSFSDPAIFNSKR